MRDRVVFVFACALALVLVLCVVGLVVLRLDDPRADLTGPVAGVGALLSAVLGFVLGSAGRRNGNGS